jgi:hypothetical protein
MKQKKKVVRKVGKRRARPRPATATVTKSSAGEVEFYVLQTPDGSTLNLTATATSSAALDQSAERFAEALKRLAKR